MKRIPLIHMLLLLSLGMPARAAGERCAPDFQRLGVTEEAIATHKGLPDYDYDDHVRRERARLDAMGVSYKSLSGEKGLPFTTYRQRKSGDLTYWQGVDELWEVRSAPSETGRRSPLAAALRHPDLPEALEEIQKNGYRLVVDPTLSLPGGAAVGSTPEGERVIALRATADWITLRHEMQHMQFAEFVHPYLDRDAPLVRTGRSIRELLPERALSHYAAKELDEIDKFLRADSPELAINERLSGMREFEALGFRRFLPFGVETHAYTDSFMRKFLEPLEKDSRLTAAQKEVLGEIRRRASAEKLQKALGAGAIAAPFLGYIYFSNSQGALYRAGKEDSWVYIGLPP